MRAESYSVKVVGLDGSEHEIPADTVTREEPAPASRGPYVPLAFRAARDVFYVWSERWPELAGKALRLKFPAARRRRCWSTPPPGHPVWRKLVCGEVPLHPSFLGACMFLARARAELRQARERERVTDYTRQLQGLYARNVGCRSVQRDLAIVWRD